MASFREGEEVEVFIRDVDARRGIGPRWERAIFIEITAANFLRVRVPGRRKGTVTFRAFAPEDVRKPEDA